MPKTKLKSFLKQISIYSSVIVLGIVLAIAIQMAYAAWTEPSSAPPNDNAPAPINVSTTTQTKGGTLIVATTSNSYLGIGGAYRLERNGDSLAFTNKEGTTTMIIGDDGNVGIGITAPSDKLDVENGYIKMNGKRIWNECYVSCQSNNNASCNNGYTRVYLYGNNSDCSGTVKMWIDPTKAVKCWSYAAGWGQYETCVMNEAYKSVVQCNGGHPSSCAICCR